MNVYELKLETGKRVTMTGKNPTEAATRYVDLHREARVVAWRDAERHGLWPYGGERIIQ